MREVFSEGIVLSRVIEKEDWKEGLSFFSNESDFIQVGTWKYNEGKQLLKHVHNEVYRKIDRTHEVLYVKKGKILAKIYSVEGKYVDEMIVSEGEIIILLNSGHGYTILEDDTQVLEIKNGPYLGAEIDRRRL